MPAIAEAVDTTMTHLSLNVADLQRSIAFYQVLFGLTPSKCREDYAKFEVPDPPVVLSLQPGPRAGGASLSHLGLRLPTAEMVAKVQQRLDRAGIETHRQDGVICGYARQSKAWVCDPDRNWWEIYVLEEDIDPKSVGAKLSDLAPATVTSDSIDEAKMWEHSLSEPFPATLHFANGTLDEVRLSGTWNTPAETPERQRLLAEVFRALKPGGKLSTRGLVGDRPFAEGTPALPGPASVVGRVPVESEPVLELLAAGFIHVQITKFPEAPYLTLAGVSMREQCATAVKPLAVFDSERRRPVLYKGPLAKVSLADGTSFPRGARVEVDDRTWENLLVAPYAKDFVFAEPGTAAACNAH